VGPHDFGIRRKPLPQGLSSHRGLHSGMPFTPFLPFDPSFLGFLSVAIFVVTVIIHIACFHAIGAWLRDHPQGAVLLDGGIWKLVGLVFGVMGLVGFWLVNMSNLRAQS